MTERFTLLEDIGRGGMGVVWKARDEATGQIVALKVLHAVYASDPAYVTRFERELELARRIHSPNVVAVLGYGFREGAPYLVLEYVDGPSLRDQLKTHGPYSWPETRALLTQITRGLADAHAAGVIHRDVKPSNVLLAPDGTAKLADFGIAKALDLTRVTGTSTILGTPAYLPPEGTRDERSDLYSLGALAYELLTGAPPFAGETYADVLLAHLHQPPDLTKLPAEARPLIGWLLAKDPNARPRSTGDLLAILYGAAQPPPPPTPAWPANSRPGWPAMTTPGRVPAYPPPTTRNAYLPVIFGLGAVGLVACLVVAMFATGALGGLSSATATPPPSTTVGSTSTATSTPPTSATSTPALNPGVFTATGSMTSPRWHNTATALSDGRVLITGGTTTNCVNCAASILASAELYDPAAGTFAAVGSMTRGRDLHTATLLSDGRVLVVGGIDPGTGEGSTSAEIYDPGSRTFSPTGSLTTRRCNHTATLLRNGRVLIVGGSAASGMSSLASAELYDPATGTFSQTGSTKAGRSYHTATLLPDGRVLVAGGVSIPSGAWATLASAEAYDSATGSFSATGSMTAGRYGHTATALSDGRVLVAGGVTGATVLSSAEIFDSASDTFTGTGAMSSRRGGHAATLLSDGRVLIAGGITGPSSAVSTAELYNPSTGTLSPTGSMTAVREFASAVRLSDGRILIVGGYDFSAVSASGELYQP